MRTVKILSGALLAVALTLAVITGVASLFTEAHAAPCICPKLYAPVVCDHGKWFANQCLANCRNAQNCVPTGEL